MAAENHGLRGAAGRQTAGRRGQQCLVCSRSRTHRQTGNKGSLGLPRDGRRPAANGWPVLQFSNGKTLRLLEVKFRAALACNLQCTQAHAASI